MSGCSVTETTARHLLVTLAHEQVNARAPSLVAAVLRDGDLVWWGSRGRVVRAESQQAPTADTQYRVGSITKVMTAILVLQLRDEGALALSDRLDVHLPGIAFGARTLRELLSHSSGMPAEPPGPWWERSPGVPFATLAAALDEGGAPFEPGQEFHYSNVGYALLGEVVARHRATSWMAALESHLLTPLGMLRTTYDAQPPAAEALSVDPFSGVLTHEPTHDAGAMAPAGQLWSTAGDLCRLAAFLAEPDPSVLAPTSVREMTVGHTGSPDGAAGGSYGLGLRLSVDDGRLYVGHTGSVPGFLAGLFVDRARGTAAVCLANAGSGVRGETFPLRLLSVLEDHEPSLPEPWLPSTQLPDLVHGLLGLWHWGNMAVTMSHEDGALVVRSLGGADAWTTFSLRDDQRIVGATGYFAGETLTAVRRADGSVGHLECATFIFTRVPYDPEAPVPGG